MARLNGHQTPHISVLKDEVIIALSPKDNEVFVDGTFGAGGYTRAILEEADCKVFAIDCDPQAIKIGQDMELEFLGRLKVLEGQYSNMVSLLASENISKVDGVALDIGVSSMQIDEAYRGFSFQKDGPLDMRMRGEGETAADVVNTYEEEYLADIFYTLGDEKKSRYIARAIVERRGDAPFTRTLQLAELVSEVVWMKRKKGAKYTHPATKVFQALRIHVNDELGELKKGLMASEILLKDRGRLAVVSFHSLEDRIVKAFLIEKSGNLPKGSRHLPEMAPEPNNTSPFMLLKKGSIKPGKEEKKKNPRSRSSRLRVGVRVRSENERPAL